MARNVGALVEQFADLDALQSVLAKYAEALAPWARRVAARMIGEVDDRDRDSWRALGESISSQLHQDLRQAPIGERVRELMDSQVELITSIPRQAAQRAHELVLEGLEGSKRAGEIATEIARTTEVTRSRALLIARTETSRVSTVLTQARAEYAGSEAYIWRTSADSDVRKSHRKMEGRVVHWDSPPTLDNLTGHAGALPNCRCWCEALVPDPYQPSIRGRRS